jgi:hypothetical protein
MPLRSGKNYLKSFFPKENQPFRLVLLPQKNLEFNHSFDESSKEWRKNKIYHGYGQFSYK